MKLLEFGSPYLLVDGKGYISENKSLYEPISHSKWCNIYSLKQCNCQQKIKSPAPPLLISQSVDTQHASTTKSIKHQERHQPTHVHRLTLELPDLCSAHKNAKSTHHPVTTKKENLTLTKHAQHLNQLPASKFNK